MKVKVQVKDLLNALEGMDPDAVIFEYNIPVQELIEQMQKRKLEGFLSQVREQIQKEGIEAFFQVAEGRAAPVLEMQHRPDHGS